MGFLLGIFVRLGEHELHYFRAKNYLGVEDKGGYKIASVEKCIYDSLLHMDKVDAKAIMKALFYAKLDSKLLLKISAGEDNAFFQRLGYLLSLLPRPNAERKVLLAFCAKRKKSNTYLQGRSKGKYVKEWMIVDNICKEVLLSWLRQ